MKHKGNKCDFTKERNSELLQAYRKLIAEKSFIESDKVFKEVINMPASRFWVSEERAAIVLSLMMNGDKLKNMLPSKREMFFEIFRRAKELRKKNPQYTFKELAQMIVVQPAPKFYLTSDSAMVIITCEKKRWYEERRKKLRHLFG